MSKSRYRRRIEQNPQGVHVWLEGRKRLLATPSMKGREEEDAILLKGFNRVIAMYDRGESTPELEQKYCDVIVRMLQQNGKERRARELNRLRMEYYENQKKD